MLAKKQETPFLVALKPSKKLRYFLVVAHGLAICASFANALPLLLKLAVATCVAVNFILVFPKHKKAHHRIKYTQKVGWEIADGGDFESVDILTSTVITTLVVVLHSQQKAPMLIVNDTLSEGDYRQLVVKLKMTAHQLP